MTGQPLATGGAVGAAGAGAAPAAGGARAWRTSRITPLGELLSPGRMAGEAARVAFQVVLVVFLWRALYAHTPHSAAGLTREQAVAFAVLAALAARIRGLDRYAARDTVLQHLYFGTIVYWFLRPLPPRRYYLYRALGDQAYGLAWGLAGYGLCRAAGLLSPPASAAAGFAFAAGLLLGQAVYYQLGQLIDLLTFWTLQNGAALLIVRFAQNLLSGAYAPLWFFPGWFLTLSAALPFQATLNLPLSLYVGRIAPHAAPAQFAVQAAWIAGLALLNRRLWRRAAARVASQGG